MFLNIRELQNSWYIILQDNFFPQKHISGYWLLNKTKVITFSLLEQVITSKCIGNPSRREE